MHSVHSEIPDRTTDIDDNVESEDDAVQTPSPAPLSAIRIARHAKFAQHVAYRSKTITKDELKKHAHNTEAEEFSVQAIYARRKEESKITTPREYQRELCERAKQQNVIAVLDTGSGKTHIAVLLLQHVFAQELEERASGCARRISFFLVDSVALVMQQSAVLESSLPCKVAHFYGAMGVHLWSKEAWRKHFLENEVIVCTAEILHQCLFHAFISINDINILIFDEAHHAKKSHSYARIMGYYQDENLKRKPRIFGMTASPVDVKADDLTEEANDLEKLLDSRIITASDLTLLQNYIARPDEDFCLYPLPSVLSETSLHKQLKEQFGKVRGFEKLFDAARLVNLDLGPWCADLYWVLSLSDKQTKKKQKRAERSFYKQFGKGQKQDEASTAELDQEVATLQKAARLVGSQTPGCPELNLRHLSGKVIKLYDYLQHYLDFNDHFRCIVFVERRYTAKLLWKLFELIGGVKLRPAALTGMSSDDEADAGTSFFEQHSTLDRFRDGKVNCLFATSIAEEGLDIQQCNLVIRFDLPKTMIQYVQSRGRARRKDSTYVFMMERDNWNQRAMIDNIKEDEVRS